MILNNRIKNSKHLPLKCLVSKVLNILNLKKRENTKLEMVKIATKNKIELIEVNKKEQERSMLNAQRSTNLKYPLNNRSKEDKKLLIKLSSITFRAE